MNQFNTFINVIAVAKQCATDSGETKEIFIVLPLHIKCEMMSILRLMGVWHHISFFSANITLSIENTSCLNVHYRFRKRPTDVPQNSYINKSIMEYAFTTKTMY